MAADTLENLPIESPASPEEGEIDELATSLANADVQDASTPDSAAETEPPRPLHIYTRRQLVSLSRSPLVKVPDGMPELKDWFGYVFLSVHRGLREAESLAETRMNQT